MVTFPKLSLREITLPSGFGAEKSVLHLASAGAAGAAPGTEEFTAVSLSLIALPGLVFFNSSSNY